MSFEPERRKSRKSTSLYLHVSQRLSKTKKSRRPFSVAALITRRSDREGLHGVFCIVVVPWYAVKIQEREHPVSIFCKRSISLPAASLATEPIGETFVKSVDADLVLAQEAFLEGLVYQRFPPSGSPNRRNPWRVPPEVFSYGCFSNASFKSRMKWIRHFCWGTVCCRTPRRNPTPGHPRNP